MATVTVSVRVRTDNPEDIARLVDGAVASLAVIGKSGSIRTDSIETNLDGAKVKTTSTKPHGIDADDDLDLDGDDI